MKNLTMVSLLAPLALCAHFKSAEANLLGNNVFFSQMQVNNAIVADQYLNDQPLSVAGNFSDAAEGGGYYTYSRRPSFGVTVTNYCGRGPVPEDARIKTGPFETSLECWNNHQSRQWRRNGLLAVVGAAFLIGSVPFVRAYNRTP